MKLTSRPASKQVQLMATCLCDAFYDGVAKATVEVLEHLGCEVEFPENQTCCGQPAFNAGDWPASRQVVRHACQVFAGDKPVIVPSGSCAAMMFHGAGLAFEKEADLDSIEAMGQRTWELADFIVNGLGVTRWRPSRCCVPFLVARCWSSVMPNNAAASVGRFPSLSRTSPPKWAGSSWSTPWSRIPSSW